MCKFIGKSNERILCKLNKSEILRLYSIIHVAMETAKTSNFTCQLKSFNSIVFTCQVSACELQPFSCHDLANDIHSQTAKTVFSHLNNPVYFMCTHHTAGALPLGVWITSDQSQHVTKQCREKLQSVLPQHAFGTRGPKMGVHKFL